MDKSRKGIIRSGLNLISIAAVLVLFFAIGTSYAADRVEYCHTDALGSVIASTDDGGNVLWSESYRPFGDRMLKQVSTQDNTPFYTGKPHDDATGLSYFGARYYDPNLGRFLGVDPAGVDPTNLHSFNRYAYANNNPYKYVDPDGRTPLVLLLFAPEIQAGLAYAGSAIAGFLIGAYIQENAIQPVIDDLKQYNDKTDDPKAKASNSDPDDVVRTPDTHPDDFSRQSKGRNKNTNTGEIWEPSNTNHSGSKDGEWKVGTKPGKPPRPGKKITVEGGERGGRIIKVDK